MTPTILTAWPTGAAPTPSLTITARSSGFESDLAATSYSANLPSGSESDALAVLAIRTLRDDRKPVQPTGWETLLVTDTLEGDLGVFYRTVTGALASVTVSSTGGSARAAWAAWRLTGAAITEATFIAGASTFGGTDPPNPPSVTPSWGSAENAWLAIGSVRRASNTLALPPNYSQAIGAVTNDEGSTDTLHGRILGGSRFLTAVSEDPSSFGTTGTFLRSIGVTVAVRPA